MKLSIYLPDDLAAAVETMYPNAGWSERCQRGLTLLLAGASEDQIKAIEDLAAAEARRKVRALFEAEP
jgi:hypothetical protein